MTFRPARTSDAASLAAISIEVWTGTYLRDGVTDFFADFVLSEFTPDRFRMWIDTPGEHLIVSERGDGIDGYICVSEARPAPIAGLSDVEITTLYLQPRHHGQGIGAGLLQQGLALCAELGAQKPWLATNAENTPALAFYQRQGFAIVGDTHFTLQDQQYLNRVLARDLTLS